MKKFWHSAIAFAMSAVMIVGVAGCVDNPGGDDTGNNPGNTPGNDGGNETTYVYSLDATSLTLDIGDTHQLVVSVTPTKEIPSVTYTSSAPTIASVSDEGLVTAVAEGTANITAKVDGQDLVCAVTVNPDSTEPIEYEYWINPATIELETTETRDIEVLCDPEGASFTATNWTSGDTGVATVASKSNATATVTAIGAGSTTITAEVDGETVSCSVTVSQKVITYTYYVQENGSNIEDPETNGITLSNTKLTTKLGVVALGDDSSNKDDVTVSYTSLETDIAEVTAEGDVTAKGIGSTTIAIVADGKPISVKVTVTSSTTLNGSITMDESSNGETLINLTDADDTYETLYWEHYHNYVDPCGVYTRYESAYGKTDRITTNFDGKLDEVSAGHASDFGYAFNWSDGASLRAWTVNGNRDMMHTKPVPYIADEGRINLPALDHLELTITVDETVTAIRLYTGAWNATHNVKVSVAGLVIATTTPFTAGEDSIAKQITIPINVTEETEVLVTLTPTNLTNAEAGNVSLPAVVVLGGEKSGTSATPAQVITKMDKTEMTGMGDFRYNLTEEGTLDWYKPNVNNGKGVEGVAFKDTANHFIDLNSIFINGNNKAWDYKAYFTWQDGDSTGRDDIWKTTIHDDDTNDGGTNNVVHGGWVSWNVKVDSTVKKITNWVGGYESTYYIRAYNSKGQLVYQSEMLHEKVNGQTYSYKLDFEIDAQEEDILTFVVYLTDGSNVSLAAIAVS